LNRLLLFFGPPASVFLAWWLADHFLGTVIARESLVAAGLFLTFVGPTVILGPAVVGKTGFEHLSTWNLVVVAAFMSVVTAFFWTYNLDLLERVPRLGPVLKRSRERMAAWLACHRWIRRLAVFGVGFFVVLPLPGSGTMGGSVMGRILGLTRRVAFLSVSAGGVVVTLAYGYFGDEITRLSERYQLTTPIKIAVALGFLGLLWLIGKAIARLGRDPTPACEGPAGAAPPTPLPAPRASGRIADPDAD
jgi:uncharacterized membrane protein